MDLDLAIPPSLFHADPLAATNRSLRAVGSPSISNIKEYSLVLRAAITLEGAVD
jgi:hypothetical protein